MQFFFWVLLALRSLIGLLYLVKKQTQEHDSLEVNCSSGLNLAAAKVGIQGRREETAEYFPFIPGAQEDSRLPCELAAIQSLTVTSSWIPEDEVCLLRDRLSSHWHLWLLFFFNYYYFFLAAISQNELRGSPAKLPAVLLEVLFAGVPGVMLPLLWAVWLALPGGSQLSTFILQKAARCFAVNPSWPGSYSAGYKNPQEKQPYFWWKGSGAALLWRFVPLTQAHFGVGRLSKRFLRLVLCGVTLLSNEAVFCKGVSGLCVVLQHRRLPQEML